MKKESLILVISVFCFMNSWSQNHCGPSDVNFIKKLDILYKLGNRDFSAACLRHDKCYSECGTSQKQCDRQFLKDLKTECKRAYDKEYILRLMCNQITAISYFNMVNDMAEPVYLSSQKKSCKNKSQIGTSTKSGIYRIVISNAIKIKNRIFSFFSRFI